MFAILRDHGARGEMPPAGEPPTRDDSPTLCMHGSVSGTTASMVAELPAPDADTIPVMWASLAAPCTSIAFPLFVAGTLPPVLAAGGEKPSPDSPWWRFRKIQDLVAIAPGAPRADRMEAFPAARSCDARAMRRGQPPGAQARRRGARETARHLHGAKYCPRPERAVRRRIRIDPRCKLTPTVSAYCYEACALEVRKNENRICFARRRGPGGRRQNFCARRRMEPVSIGQLPGAGSVCRRDRPRLQRPAKSESSTR